MAFRRQLTPPTVALAVSVTTPTMGSFHVSVLPLGLSRGAIDATLNPYPTPDLRAPAHQFLDASYGVGVAVSPLIFTAVVQTGATWRWAYRSSRSSVYRRGGT
jgi:hypothetical protein